MSDYPLYARSTDIRNLVLGDGCEAQHVLSNLYELPDTTWFVLGTALHEAFELIITEDYSLDEMEAFVKGEILAGLDDPNLIESASPRAKRTKDTMLADAERMLGKWWSDVHPDSPERAAVFDRYEWPPRVEHNIAIPNLFTQVDTIFEGRHEWDAVVAPVDWKTGSRASSNPAQLHTYSYGGRREGWVPEDQEYVGFFWHVDHSKPQHVDPYIGDEVVEAWITRTLAVKESMLNAAMPAYVPDWWCAYCQARDICPVYSDNGLSHEEVAIQIQNATILTEPRKEGKDNE